MKPKQIYEVLEQEALVLSFYMRIPESDIVHEMTTTHRVRDSVIRKKLRDAIPSSFCECRILNTGFARYYKDKDDTDLYYIYTKLRNDKGITKLINRRVRDLNNDTRRYCQI